METKYRSLYRSEKHKAELYALYDKVLDNWPVPFREIELETPCGRTHLINCGNASGEPLLLFHGINNNSLMWRFNVAGLGERFNLYLVDTINDPGKSEAAAAFDPARDYAAWVRETLSALGLHDAFFLGHSKGGWIVLNTLVSDPALVRKACLLAPAVGINAKLKTKFMLKSISVGISPTVKKVTSYFRYMSGPGRSANPDFIEYLTQIIKGTRSRPVRHRQFTDDELRAIRRPLLIAFGDREVCGDYRKVIERAQRLIPGVEVKIVPGAGHGLQGEEPEKVNSMIAGFFGG
jgi:pimeloyl-ACP methyl ester carboxylesterase